VDGLSRVTQRPPGATSTTSGHLHHQGPLCYQDVLVLRVSGFVFGRESLPCTGLLKDLAD